jgi:hypothetical protein
MILFAAAVSLCLFAFAAMMSAFNWWAIAGCIQGGARVSWIPFIGGFSGAIALAIFPSEAVRAWWWVPLCTDYGCLPGFAYTAAFHLACLRRSKR